MSYRDSGSYGGGLGTGAKFGIGIVLVVLIFGALSFSKFIETNDAGWASIKQAPFSGEMTVYDQPGTFGQNWGQVTKYKQAITIGFGANGEDASADMGAVEVRFNDSGKAKIAGNARFELPIHDHKAMLELHAQYRSFEHLVDTLLEPSTAEVLVLTANIFSSEDTYAGGRSEFVRLALDQLESGKYLTDVSEQEQEDPLTHEKRRVKKVSIRRDAKGTPLRQESALSHYGIKATQLIISRDFEYESGILAQITAQREAFMQTVTARAEAQRAAQDAITAKAKGEASIATAEAEKLVEKKRAVVAAEQAKEIALIQAQREVDVATKEKLTAETNAQKAASVAQIEADQRLKVAQLNKSIADQDKAAAIAKGEGEATARKLILEADGALKLKLETYENVMGKFAEAMGSYQGAWVPAVIAGGGTGTANGGNLGPADMINVLTLKALKDLGIDFSTAKTPAVLTK